MDRLLVAALAVLLALVTVTTGFQLTPAAAPDTTRSESSLPDTGMLVASERYAGGLGSLHQYPAMNGTGVPTGLHAWRTYRTGGNCCEHYIATTPGGWVLNLGGAYPTWSENAGQSWTRAMTANPLLGAEGAIVAAPGGDVVGMTWDPYSGDHIVAYRYDADQDVWHYNLLNLKTPFYDRPWMSVAPGPFYVDGQEIPYVTFMRGGLAKFPQYMSLDGLHYESIEHTYMAFLANLAGVDGVNTIGALPDFGVTHELDHYNPHPDATGSPLLRGGYLAPIPSTAQTTYRYAVLDQDLAWKALDMDLPRGELFFDEAGGIHAIDRWGPWLVHNYSADNGQTWTSYTHERHQGRLEHWSFALDTARKTAVFLVHWGGATADTDEVIRVVDYDEDLRPDEILRVGNGDMVFGRGILSPVARLDFNAVSILPDGRVVAVFGDSAHQPGFAIEEPGQTLVVTPPIGLDLGR